MRETPILGGPKRSNVEISDSLQGYRRRKCTLLFLPWQGRDTADAHQKIKFLGEWDHFFESGYL